MVAGLALALSTAVGSGAVLGAVSSVAQPGAAGADTPTFNITCTGVPSLGTVQFPTVIKGSIPDDVPDGFPFTVSGLQTVLTAPAELTTEINGAYGAGAVVSATYQTTIDSTGASPASQSETLTYGNTAVPASGPFNMVGTASPSPSFTGTGSSVSIAPGPSITGFQLTVNGHNEATFACTTPSPDPIIAFAAGSNGPYALTTNPGPNTITPIDTATQTTATPFPFNDYEPGRAIAITPDGLTAYVGNNSSGQVTPVNTTTGAAGTPITVDGPVSAIAITPDGSKAYVASYSGDAVTPIDLQNNTEGTPITGLQNPDGIAIGPDGSTAYVATDLGMTPIDLATNTAETQVTGVSDPYAIAVTPNGSTAYEVQDLSNKVVPINLATFTVGSPIAVGSVPEAIAITPNGSTAYVANTSDGTVTPIHLATNTPGTPITVGSEPNAIAVTPDGSTVYVTNGGDGTASLIDTATNTDEGSVVAGGDPEGLAITPDQGPTAALTASTTGATTSFDASGSVAGTSPIVSYAWNFGDSDTAVTTTPTESHTYAGSGTYTATVTETDAAGTSTSQVFTGQTLSSHGTAAAEASAPVVITTTDCSDDTSCMAAINTPATPQTPAQSINVTAAAPGQPAQQLTVTSGPGQLNCATKGFSVVEQVASYATTFTPTANVTVTDQLVGVTSTHGVKVCFAGSDNVPQLLPKCARTSPVAPCATVAKVSGVVQVTILVAPGDPRFRIQGVQELTEMPKSVSAKGVIGQTIAIKGTELLGSNSQTLPTIAFTSVNGSTIDGTITKFTTKAITVTVPNGSATGPVALCWPNETAVSEGSVAIT